MKTYRVERYEIHTQAYLVEADSEAEAVKKTLDGLAEVAPDEFSEPHGDCESIGLPVEDAPELAAAVHALLAADPASLATLLAMETNGFIPGIKSVEAE